MNAPHPEQVPLEHTLAWLARVLPSGVRVLEIGCGRGALAAALLARGVDLTAIDVDAEAVARARARGVPALATDLLAFAGRAFGAVLFTRSLHHLHPLPAALDRARDLLVEGGALLLEEFAFERADEATTAWFHAQRTRLALAGRLPAEDAGAADPHDAWIGHHVRDHRVHEGAAMRAAVADRFAIGAQEEPSPYLYRWFADRLPADASGARDAARLFDEEARGIAAGRLRGIGMRLAARRV